MPSKRAAPVPLSALGPLPSNFTQPSTAPVFVALVTGFYNYSCSLNGTWQFDGSSGSVFDISSLFPSAEFANIPGDAFKDFLNLHSPDPFDPLFAARIESKYGIQLLGQYSDTESDTGTFIPEVDFSSTGGGSVVTHVNANAESSAIPAAVDWLEMKATSGSLAQTVLLINTVDGPQPFDSCAPGPDATSPFCAQLWGF